MPPLLSFAAAGAAAALVCLLFLAPHRRTILVKLWSLVRDPADGSMSSKRVASLSMIGGGIAALLIHPEQWEAGAVLITGGCAGLGISTNADGTSAIATTAAALRGVLRPATSPAPGGEG